METLIQHSQISNNNLQIVLVLSNRKEARGLRIARNLGVPSKVIEETTFENKKAFEDQLTVTLEEANAELICLAGFMRLLGVDFVQHWHNKIINIHPSVLPAFKGLNTHQRVCESGAPYTGCTVHFVRPGMDDGPIILQAITPVRTGEDVHELSARVLKLEHQCYSLAVSWIAKGLVKIVNERVLIQSETAH